MTKLSIHLPKKFRLDIKLIKSRKQHVSEPILPDLAKILRIKKGSKISRFFRHVFEHAGIKKILGYLIIIVFVFSTTIVPRVRASSPNVQIDLNDKKEEVVLKTEKTTQYPLKNIRITQYYRFYHRGIDLDGITGDPVYPIAEGGVIEVSRSFWAYGNYIVIEHKSGTHSLYAHLSKINVKEKDEVTKTTVIGEVGATGRSFGDHLHLEVYDENGNTIDPLEYLSK